jgi:hypothetical protein
MTTLIELSHELIDQAYEVLDASEQSELGRAGLHVDIILEICERILQIVEGEDT